MDRRRQFTVHRSRVHHGQSRYTGTSEGTTEWLVTNGLGGYASVTITGLVTHRFHGYLVASLPAPRGRTMMLNHLLETSPRMKVARGSQSSNGHRMILRE